ncbi:MAG: tetratricopeptide repeat protein, partial [Gammaproteobacteria bacterium]
SDEALTNAVNKIRKAFSDDRQNPRIIETIPKKGYRLIAPVVKEILDEAPAFKEVIHNRPESAQSVVQTSQEQPLLRSRLVGWFGGVLVLVITLATGILLYNQKPDQQSVKNESKQSTSSQTDSIPSIMVLPFRNIGDNKEDDYFIDGMTEDIITDLSKFSNMLVIAGQTALSFKNRDISPLDAGRELDTDYILDGSMRRASTDLRINAQLISVNNGTQLWAERYDRKIENIFVIQDEITSRIVEALAIRLTSQEKEALREVTRIDFQAYDRFQKGQRSYNRRTQEGVAEAIAAYLEAIQLDPTFARAFGAYAIALAMQYRMGWTDAPTETLNRALEMANKAVSIDNSIPQVYWALGYVQLRRKAFEKATRAVEQAIRIAPNYADGYALLAVINNIQGNAEKAIKNVKKGMQINPYYSFEYPYNLGRAYYLSGKYQEAIDYLSKALEMNETVFSPRLYLIASYIKQGLVDDAEWEAEQLMTQNPNMTISQIRRIHPDKEELLNTLLNDLRKAGLPE